MMLDLKLNNINDISEVNDAKSNKLVFIPIDQLVSNPQNSKELFIDDSLKESIREIGLNVPLDVMERSDGKYEISSGERRFAAFLSLVKNDPEFKYLWKGNTPISPVSKGIPCTVNRRTLSDEEKSLIRLTGNKSRDYDPLEIYNLFLTAHSVYMTKKAKGEIVFGDGRKVEWLANYLSVSPRTIQKMVEDKWIINTTNYEDVKKAGSYSEYKENVDKTMELVRRMKSKDKYNKEYGMLKRIYKHHQKIDFEKLGLEEWQISDLRKSAISTILSIMESYGIEKRELSKRGNSNGDNQEL